MMMIMFSRSVAKRDSISETSLILSLLSSTSTLFRRIISCDSHLVARPFPVPFSSFAVFFF